MVVIAPPEVDDTSLFSVVVVPLTVVIGPSVGNDVVTPPTVVDVPSKMVVEP